MMINNRITKGDVLLFIAGWPVIAFALIPLLDSMLGVHYNKDCEFLRTVGLVMVLVGILPSFIAIIRVERRYRRARQSQQGICQNCGYDLRGNVSDICPECGCVRNNNTE